MHKSRFRRARLPEKRSKMTRGAHLVGEDRAWDASWFHFGANISALELPRAGEKAVRIDAEEEEVQAGR